MEGLESLCATFIVARVFIAINRSVLTAHGGKAVPGRH